MVERLSSLRRELLRKLIHLSVLAAVPLMYYSEWIAVYLLCLGSMTYAASEQVRIECRVNGCRPTHLVQKITLIVSREKESLDVVWAPIALALGAVFVILLFPGTPAAVGIYCLAFGDTAALIAGKIIGGPKLPFSKEKSIAGAAACWMVCSLVAWSFSGNIVLSIAVGAVGAAVESIQIQNADNILLPLSASLAYEAGMHLFY